MTQYARTSQRSSPLSSDFAQNLLRKWVGNEVAALILDNLPTKSRGKNTGEVKGFLCWTKVEEGGWSRIAGRVLLPGVTSKTVSADSEGRLSFGLDVVSDVPAERRNRIRAGMNDVFDTTLAFEPQPSDVLSIKERELSADEWALWGVAFFRYNSEFSVASMIDARSVGMNVVEFRDARNGDLVRVKDVRDQPTHRAIFAAANL